MADKGQEINNNNTILLTSSIAYFRTRVKPIRTERNTSVSDHRNAQTEENRASGRK